MKTFQIYKLIKCEICSHTKKNIIAVVFCIFVISFILTLKIARSLSLSEVRDIPEEGGLPEVLVCLKLETFQKSEACQQFEAYKKIEACQNFEAC